LNRKKRQYSHRWRDGELDEAFDEGFENSTDEERKNTKLMCLGNEGIEDLKKDPSPVKEDSLASQPYPVGGKFSKGDTSVSFN